MNLELYLLEPSGVTDLANFQEADAPPAAPDVPRLLREAEVLRPGSYTDMHGQRVSFTEADLQEYARNYNPADPPPIQLDHSKSARGHPGLRAVAARGGGPPAGPGRVPGQLRRRERQGGPVEEAVRGDVPEPPPDEGTDGYSVPRGRHSPAAPGGG